jgi:hypothetical protein
MKDQHMRFNENFNQIINVEIVNEKTFILNNKGIFDLKRSYQPYTTFKTRC